MAEHPNAELLRKAFDAFSRGDLNWIRDHWTDDIVYHVPAPSAVASDYRGKDGVMAYLAKLRDLTKGSLQAEVHDVLANDEHGVALLVVTASSRGKEITWNQINIYHLRDGKIAEAWTHLADQGAVDEFSS